MKDRIYIVTDRKSAGKKFFEIVQALVDNGMTFIQLREKDLSAIELYKLGKRLQEIGERKGLKLVINDRVDVAVALKAYGVQLTERSLTPDIVRVFLKKIKIGLSVHDKDKIKLFENVVDFFVFGNVFETDCKPGFIGKGITTVKNIASLTEKPVYAIGGINADNMQVLLKAGAYGVAMRGAIFSNKNYLEEINKIKNNLKTYKGQINE